MGNRRKPDGPRQLPRKLRSQIARRLSEFARRRYGNARRFGQAIDANTSTTSRWFGPNAALPDAPALYRMTVEAELSLDWLMTGEGPELRGLTVPLREVGDTLREVLVAELVAAGVPRAIADQFTPDAETVLADVTRRHLRSWREYEERDRLLAKLYGGRRRGIADLLRDEIAPRQGRRFP